MSRPCAPEETLMLTVFLDPRSGLKTGILVFAETIIRGRGILGGLRKLGHGDEEEKVAVE